MVNMYRGIPFSPQAALVDKVGESDTIIKVTDISAFPDAPNYATIGTDEGGETILYAAKTADSLSGCVRGVEGSAKSWTAGTTIARNFTSKDMEALQDNIKSAQTAADNAQTAADNAQTTADNAIPKSGGDVTGELRMNGQPISGLNQPTEDTQAANKEYVDGLAVFRDLGTNPITSTTADTPANWDALGNGRAYYKANGYLTDQPNRYGILLNLVYGNDVYQLFNAQSSGPTYYRTGNSSGWNGTWKKYMDSGQIPAMAVGTSYALQEKFLGKQVYMKLVNCGAGPNNTTKTVAHGLGSNDVAFDIGGMAVAGSSGSVTSSFYLPHYQHTGIDVDKNEIKVYSTANLSGYTVYIWFKYITF